MAQEQLNLSYVGVFEELCGVGVAEHVWCDVLGEDVSADPFDELLNAVD